MLGIIIFLLISLPSFFLPSQTQTFLGAGSTAPKQNEDFKTTTLKQIHALNFTEKSWTAQPMFETNWVSSLTPQGLSPSQIRKAYNLPSSGGSGTIAIIDAYDCPTVQNDFVVFSTQYGLPTNNLEIHKMASSIPMDVNWSLEISLDVQWAHAIAPNATILLVEAKDNHEGLYSAISYATSRPDVVAVSMSWGAKEDPSDSLLDSYFNSPGKVFFASSGDNGSKGGVSYPSTSPNVVAVGGTLLTLNVDGSVASETGWAGSGGGISSYESEPDYQLMYGLTNPGKMRVVPDVSYNADQKSGVSVYDSTPYYTGQTGWMVVGGTSAGAPQWAAIYSLGLSATNINFYQDAKYNSASYFRDIVTGSNGAYSATTGFDLVTGLGSPITWNFNRGTSITSRITVNTPGLPNASNVVHYFQNGVSLNGSIVANSFSDFADVGTTLTIDNPIYVSDTQRYITTDQNSIITQSNFTLTVNFTAQYYININSTHGASATSQWINQGGNVTASVTSPTEVTLGDHQWICDGYSLDGGSSKNSTSYTFVNIQAPHTLVFSWKLQYWIQINSLHGLPTASSWANANENFTASVTSPVDILSGDHQWVCSGYQTDGGSPTQATTCTLTAIASAHSITFDWKIQFYLTVISAHGVPLGSGWYDSTATANSILSSGTVSGGTGVQYIFTGWSTDASGTDLTSSSLQMNGPKTATANWKTQYYLTVNSPYGIVGGAGWHDSGAPIFATVTPSTVAGSNGTQYVLTQWTGDSSGTASPSQTITMNGPKMATANWKTQYYLTISSNLGSVDPQSGWYDTSSIVNISSATTTNDSGERYVWVSWKGTGSGSYTGTENMFSIAIIDSISENATWKHQYLLTIVSAYGSPTPISNWYDAGTSIQASVDSPVTGLFITQNVCNGWAGTGSALSSGHGTSTQFTIYRPSSITWLWETQYVPISLILVILLLTALVAATIFIRFLRFKRQHDFKHIPPPPTPSYLYQTHTPR